MQFGAPKISRHMRRMNSARILEPRIVSSSHLSTGHFANIRLRLGERSVCPRISPCPEFPPSVPEFPRISLSPNFSVPNFSKRQETSVSS